MSLRRVEARPSLEHATSGTDNKDELGIIIIVKETIVMQLSGVQNVK